MLVIKQYICFLWHCSESSVDHVIWRGAPPQQDCVSHKKTTVLNFLVFVYKIKKWEVIPEGEGKVCDIGVALSDQKGAISSPSFCAVILD